MILFAMHEIEKKGYVTSARLVGDTLGKSILHGDVSTYGVLVNMARDFTTRYLLFIPH